MDHYAREKLSYNIEDSSCDDSRVSDSNSPISNDKFI